MSTDRFRKNVKLKVEVNRESCFVGLSFVTSKRRET